MKPRKICVAVGEKNDQELYKIIDSIVDADCIEVRLDYLAKIEIEKCFENTDIDLLFTCRASWEGGLYDGIEDDRVQLFKKCIECGASFVDLELASPLSSIESIISHKKEIGAQTKLILSHHNFSITPAVDKLKNIVLDMRNAGADIGKLITTASDSSDMLSLFSVLDYAKSIKFPLVAFCMGEAGVMSRVACCDFGSYMTYCAADGKDVTAPSQLKLSTMGDIFAHLPS